VIHRLLIDAGWSRSYIRDNVNRIRRAFRWAASEELLPVAVYEALRTVTGLRRGRSAAREPKKLKPVPVAQVKAVLPKLTKQVAAIAQLQLVTGARPGEICKMRPRDITRGIDGLWLYRPSSHKTDHHGHERRIYLGAKAQKILRPWLDRDPDAYCFSPAEAVEARNERCRKARKLMTLSQTGRSRKKNPKRTPGAKYTKDSYRTAIARACAKADIPVWTPNQLRHTQGTLIRGKFGLEASQVVLGHSTADVTQIYAERDFDLAKRVMREMG